MTNANDKTGSSGARKSSWTMLLPLIVVITLAIAWTAYWFVAQGIARDRVEDERQRLAARGITLTCTEESWAGYPFRFEFWCSSPVAKVPDAEIRSANLAAVALAYKPWQVVLLLDGPTTVSAKGLLPTEATHHRIVATVTLDKNYEPWFSADIPELSVPGQFQARRIGLDSRPEPEGAIGLAASAVGIVRTAEGKPPLSLDRAEFLGSLSRDRKLTIQKIEMAQGAVRYWGAGEVMPDSANRASGKISTETNDLNGLFAIIEPQLDMTDQQKTNLRAMIGLLGSTAKLDIIAKDGQLFLGPFKVADLVPLF